MTSFLPFVVQCLRKYWNRMEKENKLFLHINVNISFTNFSVDNDPMKGVESFTVLFFE